MALGDLMASRLSQSSAALDEFGNEDGERSNVRDSDTASSSYVGGGVADNAMTTTSMAYFPQTIVLCELRHDGFEDSVPSGPSDTGLVSKWRPRDRVVDCRICGDPHSRLRFAFVEFADEYSARAALCLCGTILGYSPLKVLPSKTAILPVNPTFLPRSEDEREMCARTVYCTNIDKKVTQADVKNFFETRCGEVSRLRLLGDHVHSTRIAFVEFFMAGSAILALDCCGEILGAQRVRVSPSKTPVRPRLPRA